MTPSNEGPVEKVKLNSEDGNRILHSRRSPLTLIIDSS